jgi:hypothetical protein
MGPRLMSHNSAGAAGPGCGRWPNGGNGSRGLQLGRVSLGQRPPAGRPVNDPATIFWLGCGIPDLEDHIARRQADVAAREDFAGITERTRVSHGANRLGADPAGSRSRFCLIGVLGTAALTTVLLLALR